MNMYETSQTIIIIGIQRSIYTALIEIFYGMTGYYYVNTIYYFGD